MLGEMSITGLIFSVTAEESFGMQAILQKRSVDVKRHFGTHPLCLEGFYDSFTMVVFGAVFLCFLLKGKSKLNPPV